MSTEPGDDEICECGHIYDEHEDGQECLAEYDGEPCECVYFDGAE